MKPGAGARPTDGLTVGDDVVVEAGRMGHGGFAVARHEGQVVFVRHALPGEQVRVRVTESGPGDRFVRGDAVEVLRASPHRVPAPCAYAAPGLCGGCDFQHVDLAEQRRIKAGVVQEQLSRLAGIEWDVIVEPVAGDRDGLRWRTRSEFAVGEDGQAGMRRHRSHDIVTVDDCLIATDDVINTGVLQRNWAGSTAVDVVAPSAGDPVVVQIPTNIDDAPLVLESVHARHLDRTFGVNARGFWQVHPGASGAFVDAVIEGVAPQPGERCLDLYAGVGLFADALGAAVGETGQVLAVEADAVASAQARVNLADTPWVHVLTSRVDHAFGVESKGRAAGRGRGRRGRIHEAARRRPSSVMPPSADVVVLDPPRSGAEEAVVAAMCGLQPRSVAYVACDPAALARDTAYLTQRGYALASVRAFDTFPMTHHVECVAIFERGGA